MELKKSAIDLTELAIGIVILGIVVSIGAYMLITMRDTRLTDLTVATTNVESITPTDSPGTNFANAWFKTVTFCQNGSTGKTIQPGNYTTTTNSVGGQGRLINLTSEYTDTAWKCNYTWYNTSSRVDWTLSNQSAVGLGEYGNWFKIIVIVGVAALVLGLIFMAFGKSPGMSSQTEVGGSY